MDTREITRDIFDWFIGIVVILAFILRSIVLPILFLIPVFFVWRAISTASESVMDKYRNKLIKKNQKNLQKALLSILSIVLLAVWVLFIYYWKIELEYYWVTYVTEPAVRGIATFLKGISGFFHKMYDSWREYVVNIQLTHRA